MPVVKTDRLTLISAALLRAAGASDEEADAVPQAASTPTSPVTTPTV
ncbi:hypothetical protein HAP41_0000037315 [Bradyrhizobium barranii subsp. apii]|uniref:Uncharacterized protein n=1 Tax=Bradyrhizobium barranii subsp. apii TaxID=2819348 RepID=A0A8T5VE59_9BRAD|nr:hypothetical protein HAP41_0000037315 [Bradyrhizobium barranii subsp. apii]